MLPLLVTFTSFNVRWDRAFERDAMFARINGESIFIRGGKLDHQPLRLNAKSFAM